MSRLASTVLLLASSLVAAAPRAPGPACGDAARLVAQPERPRQGTLFRLRVLGVPAAATLHGTVGGEPLHFAPDGSGAFQALAAAPIDAPSPLRIAVACSAGEHTDSLRTSLALASG
jgi:hypothetical protein